MTRLVKILTLLCMSLGFATSAQSDAPQNTQALGYQVIAERHHKSTLFTQGLEIADGLFYESSGLYGKSQLVAYPVAEPEGGTWAKISAPFTRQHKLADTYFAEGLTLVGDKLYLLTWKEGTLLVFNKNTFTLEKRLSYQGEGWGLAYDGKQLIRSDGSSQLHFHAPDTFARQKSLQVHEQGQPVSRLNELEYHAGFIWANIWYQDRIIKINPANGEVVATLDLTALREGLNISSREQTLNGIAWDETQQGFWVTGKLWPKMFLLRIDNSNAHKPEAH